AEYQSVAYLELDLPAAPAVMVVDEVVVEGSDIAEEDLVAAIRQELGMPPGTEEERYHRSALQRMMP
ncbi:MAG: hypothetical protein FJY85_23360, partial [Deltaproteobacteria bacterium]|nr:hypothetical protein [Deltaproteobacteria bacterium]